MNIPNIRLRRQESTASAPSLIVSSAFKSSSSLTGNDSSSLAKASPDAVKLSAQQLQVEKDSLITKSTSSLLSIQQERISSALRLKRKNLFIKSASEDSNIQQDTNLQSDSRNQVYAQLTVAQQHHPTRWRRFLQMKRGKSVCESVTDLSSSGSVASSVTNSTETEPTNDTNLKTAHKDTAKVKHMLYAAQSSQSLTNKLDSSKFTTTKLAPRSTNKSDNKLYTKLDSGSDAVNFVNFTKCTPNQTPSTTSTTTPASSTAVAVATTAGFRYHKRRKSRRGSYRSNIRSNRGNLTTQFFRTSFDSAVQHQSTAKRNANLILQDASRACSFDNSCLTSERNYSYQLGYLIDDVHQLSLDDNER